jgi:hypothetical protein
MTASIEKSTKRFQAIRADLIRRGYNVATWAEKHNIPASTVYDALKNRRHGVVSVRVRQQVKEFING